MDQYRDILNEMFENAQKRHKTPAFPVYILADSLTKRNKSLSFDDASIERLCSLEAKAPTGFVNLSLIYRNINQIEEPRKLVQVFQPMLLLDTRLKQVGMRKDDIEQSKIWGPSILNHVLLTEQESDEFFSMDLEDWAKSRSKEFLAEHCLPTDMELYDEYRFMRFIRRRLFSAIRSESDMRTVCQSFADYYIANSSDFPAETQKSGYLQRLIQAYPIHPEVFDRLYENWSTLDTFQRTRGVLKFMAKVIYKLWKDGNTNPLIMPGDLPLMDPDTRNEALYYLPQGWDPVIEKDVDGDRSQTWEIESLDTRFGSVQACRRVARTIFLGSAPATKADQSRGIEQERIMLGAAQPEQTPGLYFDALQRLAERLHYLNVANRRFWLDTRPNLRREMEERKRRFTDVDDVKPLLQQLIRQSLAIAGMPTHVFADHADIPDDWSLHLVVLPLSSAYSKSGKNFAQEKAVDILTRHGSQPRYKQNSVLFIAADSMSVSRLRDIATSYLAWNSIVSDYNETRLVLDNLMANQAKESRSKMEGALQRAIRETWRWLMAPEQVASHSKGVSEIEWAAYTLNTGAKNWGQEVNKVLEDNELLISAWAPIHLSRMMKEWFWTNGAVDYSALTAWQQTCQMLYLPRLKDSDVFRNAIAQGVTSEDFFASAQGKEDNKYLGFVFGKQTSIILDQSLLLIEPTAAKAYAESIKPLELTPPKQPSSGGNNPHVAEQPAGWQPGSKTTVTPPAQPQAKKAKRFFGSIDLDPIRAGMQFTDVMNEVIENFTIKTGVNVRISIEIEADAPAGFEDNTVRAVKENSRVLGFNQAEFEEE